MKSIRDDTDEIGGLEDLQAKSHEFIKERLSALPRDDRERLVAGLLQAMGYKSPITASGPHRGAAIITPPDGSGFE